VRGCLRHPMQPFDSVLKRALATAVIFCMLISSMPSALADDDWASANGLVDGSSGSDSVDSDGDADDWWTINLVNGDRLDITVSSPTGDYGWTLWCFATDHWEGKVQIWDATMVNGAPERNEKRFDQDFSSSGSASVNALVNPSASDWGSHSGPTTWYILVRSKDTCERDEFDYSISPSIDTTYRDTDEDGFVDDNDDCPDDYGTSGPNTDRNGCVDNDGDGWSNYGDEFPDEGTQWEDSDGDGYGDNSNGVNGDKCANEPGDSYEDRTGCPDRDNDGWSDPDVWGEWGPVWTAADGGDAFWEDPTQWSDYDVDGYGDNWADPEWNDSHEEMGVGEYVENATTPDFCPLDTGFSFQDRMGCPDNDGDGWSAPSGNWTWEYDGADAFDDDPTQHADRDRDGFGDNASGTNADRFPDNPTQWWDTDGDGYGDNNGEGDWQADNFTEDATQWADYDRDGYGDNASGNEPDSCVNRPGSSTNDRFGCPDTDGDGYSNSDLNWPAHPEGFADAFPGGLNAECGNLCATQWYDVDGDGYGDNQGDDVWRPDSCVTTSGTSTRDRWGCPDTDRDGSSDPNIELGWLPHPAGLADAFPNEPTQWEDSDGDGYGDEQAGFEGDRCQETPGTSSGDRFGCTDTDGDGWSDQGDRFPQDASQWRDADGDGFGDNPDGHQADECPNELVNAGVSVIDRLGCPDTDGDGYSDADDEWPASPDGQADAFPKNRVQWADSDGDGFGDNPIGAVRDDCPIETGTSTIDVQGCPDGNGDGYSDDYGAVRSQLALMGSNPTSSLLTFAWPLLIFLLTLFTVRLSSKEGKETNVVEDRLASEGGEF
jgi:hypothetical protein